MKRTHVTFLAGILVAGSLSSCGIFSSSAGKPGNDEPANYPKRFDPATLVKEKVTFTPDKPERWELPNGMKVIYRFDDELPSVRAAFYLPGGSLVSGELEQIGVSDTLGTMMRDGGFRGMSPEALDKALDDLAAGVESSYGSTYGTVGCSSLKDDFPVVFGYAAEVIQHPAFDQKRFELWRKNAHQAIDRRRDNPNVMSSMIVNQVVFGKDSPYTRYLTHETLNKITIDGMKRYYAKYVHPRGTLLVATGAITKDELNALIQKNFGNWQNPPGALDPSPLPAVPQLGKPGIYVVERDFDQSSVLMAHIGPPLPHPDIPEMGVFNRLYGSGGFSNALMQEIRTKLGLAYSVGGSITPSVGAGFFEVEIGTRNDEAIRAIQKVLEVTDSVLAKLPEQSALDGAKAAVERAFIFKFESADQVTNRAAQQELLKFPPNYDEQYLPKVEAMTPQTALEVGKRWVKPEHLTIVVIGRVKAEKFAAAFADKGIPVYRVTFDEMPKILGQVTP